jgi:hypothetical protein
VRCTLPRLPRPAGRYTVSIAASVGQEMLDWVRYASDLTVAEGDFYGTGQRPPEGHRTVLVEQAWSVADPVGA